MTTRLHQVLGLTATATAVQEVTLDKPVLGVKSGYLVSGNAATYVTTPAMPEAINLTVVTDTPNADGEIYLKDANTLEFEVTLPARTKAGPVTKQLEMHYHRRNVRPSGK